MERRTAGGDGEAVEDAALRTPEPPLKKKKRLEQAARGNGDSGTEDNKDNKDKDKDNSEAKAPSSNEAASPAGPPKPSPDRAARAAV